MEIREQSVGRAVVQFAVSGAVAVLLLGLASVSLLRDTGTDEAIEDAKGVTALLADGIVGPRITTGVLEGRPRDLERLDDLVRDRVLRDPVVRVKIWTSEGEIVYSDEPRLIGSRYDFGGDELEALKEGYGDAEVVAGVSDLAGPENRFERRFGKLLEVYQGIEAQNGKPLLFESYQRFSSVAASGRDVWIKFLPALIGAMVLLWIVQIPFAYLLARRLRDRQRERSVLLQRAVDASEAERRRIAGALHDGPVQELAGVAYRLAAASVQLGTANGARGAIDDAAARTRGTMRDLRTMLVELYPATLHRAGLQAAIADLLSPLGREGIETNSEIPAALALPEPIEALLFRAAREALQNIRTHAGATRVEVRLTTQGDNAVLTVTDDGRGFDPALVPGDEAGRHFGMRIVGDLAREAGGELRVESQPGKGASVTVEVPFR